MIPRHSAILVALTAAALFGAATPLAKALIGAMSPFMVAGLFYLGSGIGLGVGILLRGLHRRRAPAGRGVQHDLHPVDNPVRAAAVEEIAGAEAEMRALNGGSGKVPTILIESPAGRTVLIEPGDRQLLDALQVAQSSPSSVPQPVS